MGVTYVCVLKHQPVGHTPSQAVGPQVQNLSDVLWKLN